MAVRPEPRTQNPEPITFSLFHSNAFVLALFFLLVTIALLTAKDLLALYHQQRAGRALTQILPADENELGGFSCLRPFIEDLEQRQTLKIVMDHLHKAESYAPQHSYTYYLLGRTLCLLGDYKSAIQAFQRFAELRPKNPLGYLEMGFALLQACPPNGKCVDGLNTYDIWRKAGVKAEDFLALAERARQREDFESALVWYQNAQRMGMELRSTILFIKYVIEKRRIESVGHDPYLHLERAVSIDTGWSDPETRLVAWYYYGRYLYDNSQYKKAEKILRRASSLYYSKRDYDKVLSEVYHFLALSLFHQGLVDEAKPYIDSAIALYKFNPWLYVAYGYINHADNQEVLARITKGHEYAINLANSDLFVWKAIVNFWLGSGNKSKVEYFCAKLESQFSQNPLEECRFIDE